MVQHLVFGVWLLCLGTMRLRFIIVTGANTSLLFMTEYYSDVCLGRTLLFLLLGRPGAWRCLEQVCFFFKGLENISHVQEGGTWGVIDGPSSQTHNSLANITAQYLSPEY